MTLLLDIQNLSICFDTDEGTVRATQNISFQIRKGETLALVGESGCGKSVTALSILRLLQEPPARYDSGKIIFEGRDILRLHDSELQDIRGDQIGMIFQEPMTSLNPIFTIGDQIAEPLRRHKNLSVHQARKETLKLLQQVSIPAPEQRIDQYPHELSGGMKQRVGIAMAIACKPRLIIADEPTTALDVTIQAQIMQLLQDLKNEMGASLLLITHNLGIVAQHADRVAVMYAGKIIETAGVLELYDHPSHPYTKGLLNSLPKGKPGESLEPITGTVPHPAFLPTGCAFHPRCPEVLPQCKTSMPPSFDLNSGEKHQADCWLFER
jgi:oligopeptide/dipeptide ABC transporter ATP-binding protein